MSRDFLVVCNDKAEAAAATTVLEAARAQDGEPLLKWIGEKMIYS